MKRFERKHWAICSYIVSMASMVVFLNAIAESKETLEAISAFTAFSTWLLGDFLNRPKIGF